MESFPEHLHSGGLGRSRRHQSDVYLLEPDRIGKDDDALRRSQTAKAYASGSRKVADSHPFLLRRRSLPKKVSGKKRPASLQPASAILRFSLAVTGLIIIDTHSVVAVLHGITSNFPSIYDVSSTRIS